MGRKLPKIITQEEFEKMFSYVQKSKLPHRKEKMVAMLLGFEAGMRISEIVGLKGKDGFMRIKPLTPDKVESASIRIDQGKGEKDRIVPRPKRLNDNAVKMLPLNIKRRTLQHFVTELGKKVLNKNISFHTLRHGFASHLAGQGRPLHEIQMLVGHSRLDTTGIYLHANPKQAVDSAREVF